MKKNKNTSSTHSKQMLKTEEKKAKALYLNLLIATGTKSEAYIVFGTQLRKIKKLRKKKKNKNRKWLEYLQYQFPQFDKRTCQRCMELSKRIDLTSYPDLKFLTLNTLKELVDKIKDENIGEQLTKYLGFSDLQYVTSNTNAKSISEFKKEVDDFLSSFSGGWSSEYPPLPYNTDEIYNLEKKEFEKLKKTVRQREKREMKRRGKYDYTELVISTNRAITKVNKNFYILLNDSGTIINSQGNMNLKMKLILNELKTFSNNIKSLNEIQGIVFIDQFDEIFLNNNPNAYEELIEDKTMEYLNAEPVNEPDIDIDDDI
jgi:hypothetical protein